MLFTVSFPKILSVLNDRRLRVGWHLYQLKTGANQLSGVTNKYK